MTTLNIKNNTLWALLEVVFSALFLFFVYRNVVHALGIGALGIWSMVLAATSLVRIVDPGTSTGLGRFIAVAYGRGETREVGKYFIVGLISTTVLYAALSLIVYSPLSMGLQFAVGGSDLHVARGLLPYAMLSFLLMNVNGAIQGALGGLQCSDRKSQIVIIGLVLQLLSVWRLVPTHGLTGLAEAQIIQYCFTILAGYTLAVRLILGRFGWTPRFEWSNAMVVQLWSFGLRLQAVSIVAFLYEPLSKFIISATAGLDVLGLYEMAQKFVMQVRQLVVGPTTVMMPAFAHLHDQAPQDLAIIYRQTLAAAFVIGVPVMLAGAGSAPVISVLWLGRFDGLFVAFIVILSGAWLVNIVGAPAYLLAMARGRLLWNFIGAAVTSFGSPLLVLAFGKAVGPLGVCWAVATALAAGSLLTMIMNCRDACAPAWITMSDVRELVRKVNRLLPV